MCIIKYVFIKNIEMLMYTNDFLADIYNLLLFLGITIYIN